MTSLVLVISEETVLSDQELFEIDCLFPNDFVAVISPGIGRVPEMMRLTHFSTDIGELHGLERLIEVMDLSAILLRPGGFSRLRKSLLSAMMSRSMPRFYQFQGAQLERYKFDKPYNGRVVFIYPGVFAPTKNGSTQRAFSLLLGLLSSGYQVEVVIPFGKGTHSFKLFLKQFGIGVHLFGHGRFQSPISFARNAAKRALGLDYYLPYFARLKFALSPEFRKCVTGILQRGDKVIVTYAWMAPTFIKRDQGVDVIVDTHDVNFVRDRNYYQSRTLIARTLERLNKWLEVRTLNKANRVLAISESDKSLFETEGLSTPVTLLEPSFEWMEGTLTQNKPEALNFGFIGSNMIANRLAVDEIINELWPRIVRARPNATLFIAGGICDHLKDRETLGTNVIPMGFVTSLEGYFAKIDALISPIMMQGGLNFKVIESLCCGVPVLVNKEAEHLESLSPIVYSYKTRDAVEDFLSFADAFARDADRRTALAAEFRAQQSAKFYSALAGILRS